MPVSLTLEPHSKSAVCVIDSILEQVARDPHALALSSAGQTLTYAELDVRSNQLAHRLLAFGAGPETAVGLMLSRSPEAAVGALAILKAGGAYVPIDPDCPAERLAFILDDARIPLVVTAGSTVCHGPVQWLHLDRDAAHVAAQPVTPPATQINPEQLAYIMFTSGSTGRPKGVLVTHGNLSNLVAWHQEAFGVTPADRASQVANLVFDAAVWELWPTLAAGASAHFPPDKVRTEPESLRDWMLGERISVSFVPTILAEYLMALPWPADTPLRYLLTGADTLQRFPRCDLPFTLVNNYGPTECTVVSTSGAVPAGGPGDEELPSIGRRIRNAQVHILDENLHPVAPGVLGEIYIGGAGVARGYLNLPALTAERFIADPFRVEPRARLYKTGDLGKFLPDGRIAFAGRTDDQIKIRGYRIEPGEIAAVLNRHPAIGASVVKACADAAGEKHLVAYLTAVNGLQPGLAALRDYLRPHLPEYMVPAEFVWLDRLPLTASGKVDRASLPSPQFTGATAAAGSAMEERLLAILKELLKTPEIGREDNFFLLGGHSLLGAQVIVKVREAFGVELSLRNLFEAPTVAGLSALVAARLSTRAAGAAK